MSEKMYLLRHGQRQNKADSDWALIAERPYDPPLSAKGRLQVYEAARRIKADDFSCVEGVVFCSPFLRCVQTAEIVCGELGCDFALEAGLSERLHPKFLAGHDTITYLDDAEFYRHYPHCMGAEEHESYIQPWPPESRGQVRRRAQALAKRIVEDYGGPWLLIGHGFTMKDIGRLYGGSRKLPRVGELRIVEVPTDE